MHVYDKHPMCITSYQHFFLVLCLFIVYFSSVQSLCCCVRAFSSCSAWASHCGGRICCGAQARVLGHAGFRSCGSWAQELRCTGLLPHNMWDLPGPGIKPASPALAGRFLTTGPPEKCYECSFTRKTQHCARSSGCN